MSVTQFDRAASPIGVGRAPESQQPDVPRRVKPFAARRLRRSLTGQGVTRLVGLLWPGRARPRHEENDMSISTAPGPTERQLRYLRTLAAQTATTFVSPATRAAASREISRLRGLARATPMELRFDGEDDGDAYATAVRPDEVAGFGSSARWRAGNAGPPRPAVRGGDTLPPGSQLARYSISAGERVLHAEANGGSLRIVDRPAGNGRSYVVEEQLEQDECAALVADYLRQAAEHDTVPMAAAAVDQLLQAGADV